MCMIIQFVSMPQLKCRQTRGSSLESLYQSSGLFSVYIFLYYKWSLKGREVLGAELSFTTLFTKLDLNLIYIQEVLIYVIKCISQYIRCIQYTDWCNWSHMPSWSLKLLHLRNVNDGFEFRITLIIMSLCHLQLCPRWMTIMTRSMT